MYPWVRFVLIPHQPATQFDLIGSQKPTIDADQWTKNFYDWDQLNQPPFSSMECGRDLARSDEIWQISNGKEWQRATDGGTAMDD